MGCYIGEEFRTRIYVLALEVFGLDFDDYLQSHDNRAFWGITIESDVFKHNPLFGDPDPRFLTVANDFFQNSRRCSEAGYKVDLGKTAMFKELNLNADVFLINPERLADDILDLDALIIHELCHTVCDSGINLGVVLAKDDLYHGKKLYHKTDIENMNVTKHTEEFCNILAAAAAKAAKVLDGFKDRWDVINRAMKHGDI